MLRQSGVAAQSENTREYRGSETDSHRYTADLEMEYRLTDRVSATASLGYERVGGDVEHSEGETGSIGLAYADGRIEIGIGTTIFEDREPELSAAYKGDDWQADVTVAGTDELSVTGSFAVSVASTAPSS